MSTSLTPVRIITGISGFIGRHLAKALVASGHQVVGVGGRQAPNGFEDGQIGYIAADTTRLRWR